VGERREGGFCAAIYVAVLYNISKIVLLWSMLVSFTYVCCLLARNM
jgi:hypothetical protein